MAPLGRQTVTVLLGAAQRLGQCLFALASPAELCLSVNTGLGCRRDVPGLLRPRFQQRRLGCGQNVAQGVEVAGQPLGPLPFGRRHRIDDGSGRQGAAMLEVPDQLAVFTAHLTKLATQVENGCLQLVDQFLVIGGNRLQGAGEIDEIHFGRRQHLARRTQSGQSLHVAARRGQRQHLGKFGVVHGSGYGCRPQQGVDRPQQLALVDRLQQRLVGTGGQRLADAEVLWCTRRAARHGDDAHAGV